MNIENKNYVKVEKSELAADARSIFTHAASLLDQERALRENVRHGDVIGSVFRLRGNVTASPPPLPYWIGSTPG